MQGETKKESGVILQKRQMTPDPFFPPSLVACEHEKGGLRGSVPAAPPTGRMSTLPSGGRRRGDTPSCLDGGLTTMLQPAAARPVSRFEHSTKRRPRRLNFFVRRGCFFVSAMS
jgi:hypothetical protein